MRVEEGKRSAMKPTILNVVSHPMTAAVLPKIAFGVEIKRDEARRASLTIVVLYESPCRQFRPW